MNSWQRKLLDKDYQRPQKSVRYPVLTAEQEAMVNDHADYAHDVAIQQSQQFQIPFHEAFSACLHALWLAAEKFNPLKHSAFKNYAWRGMHMACFRVHKSVVNPNGVVSVKLHGCCSLDQQAADNSDFKLADVIPDGRYDAVGIAVEREMHDMLHSALDKLETKPRRSIDFYFGFDSPKSSINDLTRELHCRPEMVSKFKNEGIATLRLYMMLFLTK